MPQAVPSVNPLALVVLFGILNWIVLTYIVVALRFAFGQPLLPPNTPRAVPWGAGSVLAAILVWFATTNLVSVGYSLANPALVARIKADGGQARPVNLMILSALSNGATLVLVPLTLAGTARARRRDFGLDGPSLGRQVIWGILAYPILAPGVFGMMLLSITIWKPTSHPLQEAILGHLSPGLAAIMVLASVVLAPAAEELVFRGVLLGWLSRIALRAGTVNRPASFPDSEAFKTLSTDLVVHEADADLLLPPLDPDPKAGPEPDRLTEDAPVEVNATGRQFRLFLANVVVSLVFAALHSPVWPTPIPIFFLSMGLGLLYQRTGSIVAPIALHMTFNGISTLIMFLTAGANLPGDPPVPAPAPRHGGRCGLVPSRPRAR